MLRSIQSLFFPLLGCFSYIDFYFYTHFFAFVFFFAIFPFFGLLRSLGISSLKVFVARVCFFRFYFCCCCSSSIQFYCNFFLYAMNRGALYFVPKRKFNKSQPNVQQWWKQDRKQPLYNVHTAYTLTILVQIIVR